MKSVKFLRSLIWVAEALFILIIVCGMVLPFHMPKSQEKYVLKFNHVLTDAEPFHKGLLKWSQRVAERTQGKLQIQVFHSAQLGLEEDVIEQIRNGAHMGQNTDAARLGRYVPEIAVINAPYFLDNIYDIIKLQQLPTVQKWQRALEDNYGIKVLSFRWVQGMRQIVANKPIRTPEDLAGMRIRTPDSLPWQQGISLMRAEPVVRPFGEVYIGMEQKDIDGAGFVYCNITGGRFFEVAKYVNETNHIYLVNFEVVSKEFFDSLPSEYQQILMDECDRAGLEASLEMEQNIETVKKELSQRGMTIVQDVDVAAFRKASEKVYQELSLASARDQIYQQMGKKVSLKGGCYGE